MFVHSDSRFDLHFMATIINGYPNADPNVYSYDFQAAEDQILNLVRTGRAEWQETCYFHRSENGWKLTTCAVIAGSNKFTPA
jgi:hypothetical protein